MDLPGAQFLASQTNPNTVAGLLKHSSNPAAAKAVAQQFGALLMQGMMQQNDGSAIGMADGTGGGIVNSMFASTMAQQAAKGEKLGLTDLILRSLEKKQNLAVGGGQNPPKDQSATPNDLSAAPKGNLALAAAGSAGGFRSPGIGPATGCARPPRPVPPPPRPATRCRRRNRPPRRRRAAGFRCRRT